MTLSPCRFDDSLPRMIGVLVNALGAKSTQSGVALRDATGCLSYFTTEALSDERTASIAVQLGDALGRYARPDRVLARPDDPGTAQILRSDAALPVEVAVGDKSLEIRYLDRRIVGADWLLRPAPVETSTATSRAQRVAFTSLKGGVGRSTALTVVAAEQARKGRNVLVVDLDLEAPGLGSLLLDKERMPNYGVADYLVERNLGEVEAAMLREMVGTSALTRGQGVVDVVPAIGSRTLELPGNYLAKLSRAMTEAVIGAGQTLSLASKIEELLGALEALRTYDLVLLDVRAGLAELAAGPLLALNTEILIFGTAQQQTFEDLGFLFAHLSTLTGTGTPAQWDRLKMVHAKAGGHVASIPWFRDRLWTLFSSYLYVESLGLEEFNFDANDPEAPHFPIMIPLDPAFTDWDPVNEPEKLVDAYYARTFIELFAYVDDLVDEEPADAQD
jgi:cellulose biosynthesis protein BcsQ